MDKEDYKEINSLVEILILEGVVSDNNMNTKICNKSIRFLKSKGWIKEHNKRYQYHPCSEIYDIHKVGIEKYLLNKQAEKDTETKIKQKTLFDLNNKYLINFCFLVFGSILGVFIKNNTESKNNAETLKKERKEIFEKNDSIIHFQTLLNEKNTLILSLKKEIDSLKNKP
ncbi:hypothetical protein [Flavobacterium tegetincola]|uniref:hypothetical protein n=1 Tax=Flavobacterium tegetincola TaxID=150172 RepID=UPI0003FAE5C3|nr:hypothetical protein [Flavobacterium tegetincola]